MRAQFESIDQIVVNYHVAKGIKEVINENNKSNNAKAEKDITYIIRRMLAPEVKNKQLLEIYSEIVDFVEVNIIPALLVSCSLEAMEKYRFQDASSITTVDQDNKHLSEFSNSYKKLSNVTLYDHTLHVVRNILDNYDKDHIVTKINIILCGLLHDFGKQATIRSISQEKNISATFHASVSSFFVKDLLRNSAIEKATKIFPKDIHSIIFDNLPEKIEEIAMLVGNHHNAMKNKKGILLKMINADMSARKEEINKLESKGRK